MTSVTRSNDPSTEYVQRGVGGTRVAPCFLHTLGIPRTTKGALFMAVKTDEQHVTLKTAGKTLEIHVTSTRVRIVEE
jgi:hypothetical protein